jgi:hypothetical protein
VPNRVSTALIDKTKRLPIEMTAIAPAPSPPLQAAEAIDAHDLAVPPLPPASPSGPNIPAAFEESGPLMPVPDRSRLWLGLAAVGVAAAGLIFVAVNAGAETPEAAPSADGVQTVPAAGVPESAASDPRPVATPDPTPTATPADQPAVARTEPSVGTPVPADPAAVDGAANGDASADTAPELSDYTSPAQPESSDPEPSRPRSSKRRRRSRGKKRRSSSTKGSQGLDAMYPGSK